MQDRPAPEEAHAATALASEPTGVDAELLDRLRPYLAESIMVLDRDWMVKANLAPPGGLIGRGLGLGVHTLEDMHPDDAIMVMDLALQAFATEPGWEGSKIVRMRTGDGTYGRYEITAINRFEDPIIDGMVVRTRELPHDVTEHLTGIERTSAIETLAEMLPVGVLLLDHQGRVVYANENACGMLGHEPEVLKRDGFQPLLAPSDQAVVTEVLRRVTATPGYERITVALPATGIERVDLRVTSEGADRVSCVVVTLEDVTARDAAQRDLEARANHDPLTGLLNRAALYDLLQRRVDRRTPTMVAYVDLDGFKGVNDLWGHERGDELLVMIAHALRAALGDDPELARLGGDEFVVVADPGTWGFAALGTILQDAVDEVARGERLTVSCSVGIAVSGTTDTCHDVLRRADHAMYAAKQRRH